MFETKFFPHKRYCFIHLTGCEIKQRSLTAKRLSTSGQRTLTKSRITVSSPLQPANGFVRPWPPSNTWFFGPTWVSPPNGILIGSAVFVNTAGKTPQLVNGSDNPHKLPIPLADLNPSNGWPLFNLWFLASTRVSPPNDISMGLAVFCRAYKWQDFDWHSVSCRPNLIAEFSFMM